MIIKTLTYLPYLGIAIAINILLGIYHNIANLKENFSLQKLFSGIAKAAIIGLSFIGTALVFEKMSVSVNMSSYTLKPDILLFSAIGIYITKDLENIAKILGVDGTKANVEVEEITEIVRSDNA